MHNTCVHRVHLGPACPRSNLATVKLLGRKKSHETDIETVEPAASDEFPDGSVVASARGSRTTNPKGRPTPKRDTARRGARKGPIAPAPMTASQARARRKTLAGPKLSREERRAEQSPEPRPDVRPPGTHDGRRRGIPAAARPGPDTPLRPRHRGCAAQCARPVHAVGVGFVVHHVRRSAVAALHVPGNAGSDGPDEYRRGDFGPQSRQDGRREISD